MTRIDAQTEIHVIADPPGSRDETSDPESENGDQRLHENDEFKLPPTPSLAIIIVSNVLLQISFFIIVSTSSLYAEQLGGNATFSGLVIGIPTVFAGMALIPLMRYDKGHYSLPLNIAPPALILGFLFYALASPLAPLHTLKTRPSGSTTTMNLPLALILLGRCTQGLGFSFWMYAKRYCSDPRIVGIRRRTTLAAWLVLGQGVGMSVGPGVGGWLFRAGGGAGGESGLEGIGGRWVNGYTMPAWIMIAIWIVFWVAVREWFEDVPRVHGSTSVRMQRIRQGQTGDIQSESTNPVEQHTPAPSFRMISRDQWGIILTMCWFAMTCFFILGAWESNIPVFSAPQTQHNSSPPPSPESKLSLNFSPFAAGNFIALGGLATFPFLVLSLLLSHSARNGRFLRISVPIPPVFSTALEREHGRSQVITLTFSPHLQDRTLLALGTILGLAGVLGMFGLLSRAMLVAPSHTEGIAGFFGCWFLVALGFNLASTCTLSLLSKRMGGEWNGVISLAIQYSNYLGRVTGAVWGGSGVQVGMLRYLGLEVGIIGVGVVLFTVFWRELKAKTG